MPSERGFLYLRLPPLSLGDLLTSGDLRGNLVTDAHLAALAIEYGIGICSFDSDFARFEGLHWLAGPRQRVCAREVPRSDGADEAGNRPAHRVGSAH